MLFRFYLLVLFHFVTDFIGQAAYIAAKKRGINKEMLLHASFSTLPFIILFVNFSIAMTIFGALMIFVSHLVIDTCRKELNLRQKLNPEKHSYWIILGVDQIAHLTVFYWLVRSFY